MLAAFAAHLQPNLTEWLNNKGLFAEHACSERRAISGQMGRLSPKFKNKTETFLALARFRLAHSQAQAR
jgi:hypothetical protein